MSEFQLPTQTAVFTALNGNISANVYDDVADSPDGMPEDSFPYVTLGEDYTSEWNTDDTLGATVLVVLHVWSRYSGKKETKEIMQEIYAILNRGISNLSATGYRFVDSLHEFSSVFDEADGKTRHGTVRYRITLEKE